MRLAEEIKYTTGIDSTDSASVLDTYSKDGSICEVRPRAVVFPKDKEEIEKLVKFVSEQKSKGQDISLTVRAAGTDMSGGPLGESIIVDTTRHINGIIGFEDDCVRVRPGTFFRDLETEISKRGLMLPCYPASKKLCTIGGMVMNNSAGEKTLVYGPTKAFVKEIKMICEDGKEHSFSAISLEEAKKKSLESNFEGVLYKKLLDIYENNREIINKEKPKTAKNSAGYYVWDMVREDVFDPTQIIAGSQGTFGIVTEISMRLVKKHDKKRMIVVSLKDLTLVPKIVEKILPFNPSSLESYDDQTAKLAVKFFPDIISGLPFFKKIQLTLAFIPEFFMYFYYGFPKLFMLIGFEGETESEITRHLYGLTDSLKTLDVHVKNINSGIQEEKFWAIRRESYNLLRKHSEGKDIASFIEDVVVPTDKLFEFLPRLNEILHSYDLIYSIAGHAGSGNFHVFPLMDFREPNYRDKILEISEKVYDLVAHYGGSITAEHNDGISRTPYLDKMFSKEMLGVFSSIKNSFDSLNIFNPGKKVSVSKEYFKNHLRKVKIDYSM